MYRNFIKPVLDKIFALVAIIVLAIPMLIIIIIIKTEDAGPAIFKQRRIGKGKSFFYLYKFRSMKMSTPKDVPTHQLKNPEQYLLKCGKILRKYSLDELPQLFNILRPAIKCQATF